MVDTPAGRLDALGIGWDGVKVEFYHHRDLGFIADATFYEIADWGR